MPDLRELHDTFFPAGDGLSKTASPQHSKPSGEDELARALGINKASSAAPSQENEMQSLTDIYNGVVQLEKQAHAAPIHRQARLEKKAEAMARHELTKSAAMQKTAAEYDAAGRIMARGFVDEFQTCIGQIEKLGMEGYVAGQIENDLDPQRGPGPVGDPMANANLSSGTASSSVDGVKAQLDMSGGLGGGETTKIMTVRDQLVQPAAASATNLGG